MANAQKKFLFILTSHDLMGKTNKKTGFHYSEMTDPYFILEDAGIQVDLASIEGGFPPADPNSLEEDESDNPESVQRFRKSDSHMRKLKNTMPVSEANIDDYDGIYMPGGHGTMWDFPESEALTALIEDAWAKDKIVAAVCHGPAALVPARDENGEPIVKDRRVNSFTDAEEKKVGADDTVPFLLESKLRALGARFENAAPFEPIVVVDGSLITGQNPPSAPRLAKTILRELGIEQEKEAA